MSDDAFLMAIIGGQAAKAAGQAESICHHPKGSALAVCWRYGFRGGRVPEKTVSRGTGPEDQRQKGIARSKAGMYLRRGKIIPQPCEVCGSTQVQKHHDDYSKPLSVRWLCETHHRTLHAPPAPAAVPHPGRGRSIMGPRSEWSRAQLIDLDLCLGADMSQQLVAQVLGRSYASVRTMACKRRQNASAA